MDKVELEREFWDKKKIVFGIIILAVFLTIAGFGAKAFFLNKKEAGSSSKTETSKSSTAVEGASESVDDNSQGQNSQFSFPKASDVTEKIESIKQEITNLNIQEFASSSPQVQKILNDIKNLQSQPQNQAKETICEQAKKVFCAQ